MTTHIKKNQQLPEYIHEEFNLLTSDAARNQLIRELRSVGWTLESISSAAKVTRERVRQISQGTPEVVDAPALAIEIPEPPVKFVKPKPEYIEPHPDTLARLLELQPYAQKVRANSKKFREEGEEYTALVNYARTVEGVTLYRLAIRLGITHGALRFRLARYGYIVPKSAKSKVYTPILSENRITK